MIKLKYITFIMLIASISSCGKWLDVSDSNVILEDELFKTEKGHKQQLVGVYNVMASAPTYGVELSAGYVDAIAQYWSLNSSYPVRDFVIGNYKTEESESKLKSTWLTMYEAIGNANILLEKLGESNTMGFDDYDLMKGEVLGLRAYLHFDLLRLFGPVIKNSPDGPSIPYYTKFDKIVNKRLKASEVLDLIEIDLLTAKSLLVNDPVKTIGRKINPVAPDYQESTDVTNMAKNYRAIRMNYYAVVGSLARLYQLKGDQEKAYQYAKEIIDAKTAKGSLVFDLLQRGDVNNSDKTKIDKIFSREIIFAIYDRNLKSKMGVLGSFASGRNNPVRIDDNLKSAIYTASTGKADDYRVQNWLVLSGGVTIFQKYYRDAQDVAAYDPILPMIQLSEIYYIAAEAKLDVDKNAESLKLLNLVRKSRNLVELKNVTNTAELAEHIFDESRKEYLGAGKLFYSYKRLFKDIKQLNTVLSATNELFVLPIPKDELEYGKN